MSMLRDQVGLENWMLVRVFIYIHVLHVSIECPGESAPMRRLAWALVAGNVKVKKKTNVSWYVYFGTYGKTDHLCLCMMTKQHSDMYALQRLDLHQS